MCSCILLQSFLLDQLQVARPSRLFLYSIPIEIDLLEFKMKSSASLSSTSSKLFLLVKKKKNIIKGSRNTFSLEAVLSKYFVISLEPLLVLIEYIPFGDLLGYLRKSRGLNDTYYKDPDIKPQTNLTSQQLMKFAWQIADGMSYLSSKSVG